MNWLNESKENAIARMQNYWEDSYFEYMTDLSLDERGRTGEENLYKLLLKAGLDVYWDADKNTTPEDGIYDLWVMLGGAKVRIEVKTAMRGTNNKTWQHEHIYKANVWDKLAFIDIDYDKVYFTVLDHSEMVWDEKHPVLGKKPSLREDSKDAYKVDMSKNSIQRGIDGGLTFCYTLNTDDSELIEFMREKIAG